MNGFTSYIKNWRMKLTRDLSKKVFIYSQQAEPFVTALKERSHEKALQDELPQKQAAIQKDSKQDTFL